MEVEQLQDEIKANNRGTNRRKQVLEKTNQLLRKINQLIETMGEELLNEQQNNYEIIDQFKMTA